MRIECSNETKVMQIGGFTIRYAWMCQRGYYPDSPFKENQDAFTVLPQLTNSSEYAFFAVYDGHGKDGTECARFCRDNLPACIRTLLEQSNGTPNEIKALLTKAHLQTNTRLHNDRSIDDSLSGTTAISVLFKGRKMFISNVGDSRAIVISQTPDKRLIAKPLSSDQTPYRRDERDRVKKYGARVLSMDQIEGLEPVHENWGDINLGEEIDEGGDPPRIWSPHGSYPGTAFTRSIGDMYAEELGVVADPEILERDIQPNDKYVMIASDGIFEFLTNQMVCETVARIPNPVDACRALVAQAYELWLQYEVRTDDITVIALYLDDLNDIVDTGDLGITLHDSRPVRRVLSRDKKKNMIQPNQRHDDGDDDVDIDELMHQKYVHKTSEEKTRILSAIRNNFLFQHLNDDQRDSLVDVFQRVNVSSTDVIITQDDEGDRFYIVDRGTYEVRVKQKGSSSDDYGDVVHVYESGKNQHPCFGELSLMYGKPRAASVIAVTDGLLWALDRAIFTKVVLRTHNKRKKVIHVLRTISIFRCLNLIQLQKIVDHMIESTYEDAKNMEAFHVIIRGNCSATFNGESKALKEYDYFGEQTLLAQPTSTSATITAPDDMRTLYITRSIVEEVIGSLDNLIAAYGNRQNVGHRVAPRDFTAINLIGLVSTDELGSMLLGSFNSEKPNVTIKSIVLSEVQKHSLKRVVLNIFEAMKLVSSSNAPQQQHLVPTLMASYRDENAIHMLYDIPIACDLGSFIASESTPPPERTIAYIAACVVRALEYLHSLRIIYRAVQPESIHIKTTGQVILSDFRVCKVGGVGGRTYTVCGASDYLAPEQVSQQGHNEAVDLWSLGVLLFELCTLQHPFSSPTGGGEVAIFSKITSLGTIAFPAVVFPEGITASMRSLISKLLVPEPSSRLGMGVNGFDALKRHLVFSKVKWNVEYFADSPLKDFASIAVDEAIATGVEKEVTAPWSEPNDAAEWADDLVE